MADRIGIFDTWRPGYAGAVVTIYVAGTSTLAAVYTDPGMVNKAANPQTLASLSWEGQTYGKWTQPLYSGETVFLVIGAAGATGVLVPPITSLEDVDASLALVTATGGSVARTLADRASDCVRALDHGALGTSAATNNATITAAAGVVAARGGGRVLLPSGTYPFTSLALAAGVVLVGEGRGVTILQCQTADHCVTLTGDDAGLCHLTLDGVSLVANSVGLFSKANDRTVLDNVTIKRFETLQHFKGGRYARWRELHLNDAVNGAKLHGDTDSGGGADGDAFRHNQWISGSIALCSTNGLDMSFEDARCWHNVFDNIFFDTNTGTACRVNGARHVTLRECHWDGNTTNIAVDDDDDTDNADINTVVGLRVAGGSITGGNMTFSGTCQDVVFDGTVIDGSAILTFNAPSNNILARDVTEGPSVTFSGNGHRWNRIRTTRSGASFGQTSDTTPTKAWSTPIEPGQVVLATARVLGNSRNSENRIELLMTVSAARPGADLDYDAQTANFSTGETITGALSGATALIVVDSDSGTTGTLTVREIVGEFIDDETITGTGGGSATVNGTLTFSDVTLLGSVLNERLREDVAGTDAAFVANGPELEVQVTGLGSETLDWTVHVDVVFG